MAYKVSLSNRFKKDFRRCIKRGLDMKHITDAMDLLEATGTLPTKYRPHRLSGNRDGQWECHTKRTVPFVQGSVILTNDYLHALPLAGRTQRCLTTLYVTEGRFFCYIGRCNKRTVH